MREGVRERQGDFLGARPQHRGMTSSNRVLLVAVLSGLPACSAIVSPDPSRLGGAADAGSSGLDALSGTDASPAPDAYVEPGADAAVDAFVAPGTDAYTPPPPDAWTPPPDAWTPPPVDAGCVGGPVCRGSALTRCEGGVAVVTPCPLGCADATRCSEMLPSNVDPALLSEGTRDLSITRMAVFDTGECAATLADSRVVRQGDGSEVCALILRDLRISDAGVLRVAGSRPLVIAASGEVSIDGILDVSARGTEHGPGGGAGGTAAEPDGRGAEGGRRGQAEGTFSDGGGGGGGGCGRGGRGGTGGGADGGEAGADSTTTLEPLTGGSGGGLGPGGFRMAVVVGNVGLGGGGGGAAQISARVAIRVRGQILAGGGGGGPGGTDDRFRNWGAGGGGGAGGSILLESPVLELSDAAALLASGGGGGSGGNGRTVPQPGEDGRGAAAAARGGAGGGTYGASGGDSGGGDEPDGSDGESNDSDDANGGGGGGGVGCIVLRTPTPAPLPGGLRLSPSGVGLSQLPLRVR